MIFGIGIDLAEIARIEKQMRSESGLIQRVFTSAEISYCESKKRSAENFAARFAAKEAFFKAIGLGWRDGLAFNQVEVVNDELGKPYLVLHAKAKELVEENRITSIHLSLTHTKETAAATVILEK